MGTIILLTLLLVAGTLAAAIALVLRSDSARGWRFDLGRVVGDAFRAISRAPFLFGVTVLVTGSGPLLVTGWAAADTSSFEELRLAPSAFLFVVAIAMLVGYMLLVRATLDALAGTAMRPRGVIADTLRLLPAGLAVTLLFWVLLAIGLAFFVIPGVIFACMAFVAMPVLVAERAGVIEAFARSERLTRGVRWHLFLLLVIGLIFWSVMQGLIGGVAALAGAGWGVLIAYAVLSSALWMLPPAVTASAYHHLRRSREGRGTRELAEIFA